MAKRAVVLASGGLDSTTALAIALKRGFEVVALTFDYGQRHQVEVEAVERVLDHFGIEERLRFSLGAFRKIGGSALTDPDVPVPRHASAEALVPDIPVTYVPARNLIFLSYAAAVAETRDAPDVFIGVNALDYSGYPDCRPEFVEAFQMAARLATRAGVRDRGIVIHSPLVRLTKAEIVHLGADLGVPWHLTHSCYDPLTDGTACGYCDSCLLRRRGFSEAGVVDPIPYAEGVR